MRKNLDTRNKPSSFWNGTLLGTIFGIGLLFLVQFFGSILRQPRLLSPRLRSSRDGLEDPRELAAHITLENLQTGILPIAFLWVFLQLAKWLFRPMRS